jgi:hypothetical protein
MELHCSAAIYCWPAGDPPAAASRRGAVAAGAAGGERRSATPPPARRRVAERRARAREESHTRRVHKLAISALPARCYHRHVVLSPCS